jgi:hypothetical protein
MYRALGMALMVAMVAFTGCQDTEPSRTIVSLQIDSDGEDTWIYLYTIPRVKMGNLSLDVAGNKDTLSSVFSHQIHINSTEMDNLTKDTEGFFTFSAEADLSNVFWAFACKLRISESFENSKESVVVDVLIDVNDEEIAKVWELPHNMHLEFKV